MVQMTWLVGRGKSPILYRACHTDTVRYSIVRCFTARLSIRKAPRKCVYCSVYKFVDALSSRCSTKCLNDALAHYCTKPLPPGAQTRRIFKISLYFSSYSHRCQSKKAPTTAASRARQFRYLFLRIRGFEDEALRGLFVCCWCKDWESEGDLALEVKILEFMKESEKPEVFPTKEELIDAGRMDLVEAIVKRGGWFSLGWDLGMRVRMRKRGFKKMGLRDILMKIRFENMELKRYFDEDKFQENGIEVQKNGRGGGDCEDLGRFGVSSVSLSPSSSGRSLELGDEDEMGIEGILSRLEKQRNLTFGIALGKNGHSTYALSKHGDESPLGTSRITDSTDLGRNSILASVIPNKGVINNSGGKFSHKESVSDFDGSKNSLKPETWRTWSFQRAGFLEAEFEAGEINLNVDRMLAAKDASKEEMIAITNGSTEPLAKQKVSSHNDIRTRLQHMELELASSFSLLKSKSEEVVTKDGHESSSNDLRQLSDAWEFQENEIMNAQGRLRSIRAKLAVLEGKMALAIIDAHKIVEGKQKKIDGGHRALQLLRDACIVWPNSASEVLLAGSYDGWTTQIKFIVDGVWRIDPLRPIVHHGYENNLLIITHKNGRWGEGDIFP
ncbi:5'-AMP-activated protein kinase-like protein [Actinidia rufa]|uniref:5'-AMP-activated protein kinase-like protein n=1 Tax=Actinidia rufa TaxID=165716 RepID=A0A7J0FN93_9ERIC|nr:5'-AMP-activated protein kinase-like protein [Actinidia rufa]